MVALATIAVAIAVVLAFQAEVAKPYRIPTPSMERNASLREARRACGERFSHR